jgi:hypothetical protein
LSTQRRCSVGQNPRFCRRGGDIIPKKRKKYAVAAVFRSTPRRRSVDIFVCSALLKITVKCIQLYDFWFINVKKDHFIQV